jgi:hypothetical protein
MAQKKNISDYFYGFYEGVFYMDDKKHLLLEVNL